MNIPDEAVEAAAKAIWFAGRDGQQWLPGEDPLCDMVVAEARAALEAAAPHMLAEAWDEGEQSGYVNHAAEPFGGEYTNPYRSQA